jgi:ATP-dependent helicase/nuclease subunit A
MSIKPKLCIEASAGSGKTYTLAKRYIQIATLKNRTSQNLIPPKSIGSIVGITFTNKAAAEMKERIIIFLKKLSKIIDDNDFKPKDFNTSQNAALKCLINVIKNYGDFNIATIDSFMNSIMKAFSAELGISPDYEITFNTDEIFDMAIRELLEDETVENELLEFLKTRLILGEKGMDGIKIITNALKKMKDYDILDKKTIEETSLLSISELNAQNFRDFDKQSNNYLAHKCNTLKKLANEQKNQLNVRSAGFLLKADPNKIPEYVEKLKEIITYGFENLTKKGKTIDNPDELIKLIEDIHDIIVLREIYKAFIDTHSTVSVLQEFHKKEKAIKDYLNIVAGKEVAKKISAILEQDYGVSYAYCHLGEKIEHYLIDEFQDTSKEQFSAFYPLIENSISQGGSIFVIGDKKQAIYAWRGGDYRIFDEAKEKIELQTETLEDNYRSCAQIVEFNNEIFNPDTMFLQIKDNYKGEFASIFDREIPSIYSSSYQKIIQDCEGYIEVTLRQTKDREEKDSFYKNQFIRILNSLLEKGIKHSQIMVLLRKKDDISRIVSWLDEYFSNINYITEDALILTNNEYVKKLLLVASGIIFKDDKSYRLAASEIIKDIEIDFEDLENNTKGLTLYELLILLLSKFHFHYKENELYISSLLEEVLRLTQLGKTKEEIINTIYENKTVVSLPEGLEALRIMTIHKSKGLESDSVIIPFYDWRIYDSNKTVFESIELGEIGLNNEYIFAQANKLKKILHTAEDIFTKQLKTDFIEALNLMYVANTRAKKNLFMIGTYGLNKEKKPAKNIAASNLLKCALSEKLIKQGEDEIYTAGKIETSSIKQEKQIDIDSEFEFESDLRRSLKIYPSFELELNPKEKMFGDLFHLAMSFIDIVDDKNIDELIEHSYKKAKNALNYENENVKLLIKQTLKDLKIYFKDIDKSLNEKEFVNKDGEILRIDRLVIKNGKIIIIDYKTGKKLKKHKNQIKTYTKLFDDAKGILYYTQEREAVYVN